MYIYIYIYIPSYSTNTNTLYKHFLFMHPTVCVSNVRLLCFVCNYMCEHAGEHACFYINPNKSYLSN